MISHDEEIKSLRDAVLQLRRSQRQVRVGIIAGAAAALAGVLLVGAQDPDPRRVVASQLTLTDPAGKPRAILECRDNGAVVFELKDSAQKTRLSLSVQADGSSDLTFRDKDSNPRIALGCNEGEASQLVYLDAQGKPIVALGADESEERAGLVINRNNELQGCLFFDAKGTNGLIVRDATGDNVVHAGRSKDGGPMIAITDMEGRFGIMQGLDGRNKPYIELRDPTTARLIRRIPKQRGQDQGEGWDRAPNWKLTEKNQASADIRQLEQDDVP